MNIEWRDITVPVDPDTTVWPDDPAFSSETIASHEADRVQVSVARMSVHTGTHVDAPAHYLADGMTIDSMPIDVMTGPCVVIEIPENIRCITSEDLSEHHFVEAERVLFKTGNSARGLLARSEFDDSFCYLSPDAARLLASHHVRCVGIDYLSIGGGDDNADTHRMLMEAGIWIIEGLDLRNVAPGEYELCCLPMRLNGLEAAPARVLLGKTTGGDETPDFIEDAVEFSTKVG